MPKEVPKRATYTYRKKHFTIRIEAVAVLSTRVTYLIHIWVSRSPSGTEAYRGWDSQTQWHWHPSASTGRRKHKQSTQMSFTQPSISHLLVLWRWANTAHDYLRPHFPSAVPQSTLKGTNQVKVISYCLPEVPTLRGCHVISLKPH